MKARKNAIKVLNNNNSFRLEKRRSRNSLLMAASRVLRNLVMMLREKEKVLVSVLRRNNTTNSSTSNRPFFSCTELPHHPRRPRGSQSGWEKRWDERFQVRLKGPLGTDSHRTISKNSSRCRLLIGHK